MLVLPSYILFFELFGLLWLWRRFGDLRDQIGGRGFCNAVDEDTEQWDLQESNECKGKAEENAFSVVEPLLLLLWCVANS